MAWQPLKSFRDASVPKLHNLRRAAKAGLRVPPTWWLRAEAANRSEVATPPENIGPGPLIIRSGSPSEDQATTSNAGQFLSLPVHDRAGFSAALAQVVASLPRSSRGTPEGVVFVQPLIRGTQAGIVFFDGFYYERTLAAGSNEELTSGKTRGQVTRGHLQRDDPWSQWLERIYGVFARDGQSVCLDVEFARDAGGMVLFQVRPALFPVRRNETLTLANPRETLGDLPSPWAASALSEASQKQPVLATAQPAIRRWGEALTAEVGGRVWMNLSLGFRFADSLGVPRRAITEGLGGDLGSAADGRFLWRRLLRALPRLAWTQVLGFKIAWSAKRDLRLLDETIAAADDLQSLYRASVTAYERLITTATVIMCLATEANRIRRFFRLPGSIRLVTHDLMDEYNRLTLIQDPRERDRNLDVWLARHGHRGPCESDLAQPRFAEMRDLLRQDLAAAALAGPTSSAPSPGTNRLLHWFLRPFFWMDARREWFRDAFMKSCARLRARILHCGAGLAAEKKLAAAEAVFWLRGSDLDGTVPLRETVAAAKARQAGLRDVALPAVASRDEVEAILASRQTSLLEVKDKRIFLGIALNAAVIEGRVLKAEELPALLAQLVSSPHLLGPDTILVVPCLEPCWAVVFPRVAGVIADVGGELSHASILLRECRKPALVNCTGIYRQVRTGDRVRLDGKGGVAIVLEQ
ncbi:MAG TPA: PEP-utilizing enzyme [Gemmataceae bacterium]|nr:PEP-utilizing enzyme [Gemmataceae bacterium]